MKFRYVGNPRDLLDLHPQITAFGLVFPLDQPIEVTDLRAVRKLKSNTHFEAVPGDEPVAETGADDAVATIAPEASPVAGEGFISTMPASPSPGARGSRRRG
jgi:hypothetical protein